MRYTTALSNLHRLKQLKSRTFLLALLSLSLNVLLVALLCGQLILHTRTQRTIIVPPVIEESFWVSQQHYSDSYLAQMSLFFAQLRFNATASNGQLQHEHLLRYVDPSAYDHLKQQLAREQEARIKSQMSSLFYPVALTINPQTQSATLTGDLRQIVADQALPMVRKHYQITTRYQQGRLFITSFREIDDET